MADRIVQLKDQNNNNIYPVAPFLSMGATEYSSSESGDLSSAQIQKTKTYTVSGSGLVFVSACISGGPKTWGMSQIIIRKNNTTIIEGSDAMTGTYDNIPLIGSASAFIHVSNGDQINIDARCTRYTSGNTYSIYYNLMAFNCTLTTT